jgi:hypothetical protein
MVSAPYVCLYLELRDKIEHTASLYAGFEALSQLGELSFEIRKRPPKLDSLREEDDLVTCGIYKRAENQAETRFAIDLRDRSDLLNQAYLAWSHIYFKRSVKKQSLSTANDANGLHKVASLGLNYAARPDMLSLSTMRVLSHLLTAEPRESVKSMKRYASLPSTRQFEQSAQAKLLPSVLYQTRLWTESELALSKSWGLNQRRVDLVVALKQRFGPQFKGGLIGTPLVQKQYPHLISSIPSNRRDYALAAKQHLIGVYSEGLADSTAFKFLEYLAGSQCIVAEQVSNVLPPQCLDGVHFLSFSSPNECVLHCERLLTEKEMAQKMRTNNEQLYSQIASPLARARLLLAKLEHLVPA